MEHPKLPKTLSKNPLPKIHPINDENRNNFEGTPTHRNAITLGRPKFNKISPTNNVTDEDQFSSNKPNLTRNKSTPTIYPTTSNANPYEISITIPPLPEDGKPNNSVAAGSNQNLRITNPSIIKPAITLQRISKKNSLIPGTIIRSREELHDQRFLDTSFHKPTIAHSKSLTFENGISNHNFKHRRQSSSQSLNTALNYGKKTRDRQSVAFQLEVPLNGGSIQRQSALSIPTAEVDEKVSSSTLKKNIPSAPTRARGSLTPRMSISKTDGKVVELHENSLELSMLVFSPSALENLYARECLNKNYLIVMRAISLFSAFSCITFPGVYTETKTWWFWTIWLVSVTFYILIAIFTIPALKHTAVNLLESKSASYCKLILEMGIMLVLVVETLDLPGNSEPWGSVSVIIALVTGTLPGIAIGYLHALVAMFMQWLFPIVRSFFSQESIVTKLVTYFPISVCGMLVFPDLYNRDLRRRQGYKKSKILQRENRQLIIRQQEVDTLLELALPAHVAKVLRLLSDGEIQRPIHEETPYASLSLRVQSATVMFAEFHFLHQVKFDSGKSSRSMVNAMNFVFSKVDDYLQRVPTIEKIKTVGSKALFCLGLFEEARTPLEMVNLALYISDAFADGCKRLIEAGELNQNAAMFIETKMGIETGPLVAGIVGTNKFYGDTVNTSSRCLSASSIGQIVATKNVIEATKQWVKHESIGHRYLKGKGEMELFRIIDLYDHATIGVYCNTPEKSTTLPKHPPPSPLTPIPSNPTTTKYHSSESVSTPRSSLRDVIYAMGDDMSPRIPAAASVLFTPATNANGNVKEEIGRVLIKQLAKSASAASESIVFESAMVTDTLKTVNPITLKFLYDEVFL
ncbi:hypothetical protein HK098_007681 [Nowakowskiella sp. JEL0407]|nr:hypothetical protein HK098_007681 [Nowakowskiella sp. JEL0407]